MPLGTDLDRVELWLAVLAVTAVIQLLLVIAGGLVAWRALRGIPGRIEARLDALEPDVRDTVQRVARVTDEASRLMAEAEASLKQVNRLVTRTADRVEQADQAIDAVSGAASSLGKSAVGGWVRTIAAVAGAMAAPPKPGPPPAGARRPAPQPKRQADP